MRTAPPLTCLAGCANADGMRQALCMLSFFLISSQNPRRFVRVIGNQRIRADAGEVRYIFLGIDRPVLDGQIVGMGKVDDRRRAEVDAVARLCVAERQLEHVIGAGKILLPVSAAK